MKNSLSKLFTSYYLLVILSVIFIFYYLLKSVELKLPWIDEAMFIDTPSNFLLYGKWSTTAWYSSGGHEPFSTYPPLYQFLMYVWMKLFGFSIISCRSLNYIIAFILLLTIYQFLIPPLKKVSVFGKTLLTILFWMAYSFSNIYQNARPDILNACISFLFWFYSYKYAKGKCKRITLIVLAFFLIMSGIQASVFVFIAIILSLFFYKDARNSIKKILSSFLMGSVAGLIFIMIFMYLHGSLFAFLVSLVSYSSTLKSLSVFLLPYLGPMLGLNVEEWLTRATDNPLNISIFERITNGYTINREYLVLLIFLLIVLAYEFFIKNRLKAHRTFKFMFALSIFIPFFMSIAGRFVSYYSWMSFLPILISSILLFENIDSKKIKLFFFVPLVFIIVTSLYKYSDNTDYKYKNISAFIASTTIKKNDVVLSPFSVFYDIKLKTDSVYFIGIYPVSLIDKTPNYIIISEKNEYGSSEFTNYLDRIKRDLNYKISIVDECKDPGIKLFSITYIRE